MNCKRFARDVSAYVLLGVLEGDMDTNDEVRRRRLERLCKETLGGLVTVAQNAGQSWAALDQILKRVELPPKKDGTRSAKALGDAAARSIESAHGLPEGWLDWPLDAVDYSKYAKLSDIDKGAVQARMMDAIANLITPTSKTLKGNPVPPPLKTGRTIASGEYDPGLDPVITIGQKVGKGAQNERSKDDRVPKSRPNKGS
jgi:hypothetical protein